MRLQVDQLGFKSRICLRRFIRGLQIQNERHQRFGNKAATIMAEAPLIIGPGAV